MCDSGAEVGVGVEVGGISVIIIIVLLLLINHNVLTNVVGRYITLWRVSGNLK